MHQNPSLLRLQESFREKQKLQRNLFSHHKSVEEIHSAATNTSPTNRQEFMKSFIITKKRQTKTTLITPSDMPASPVPSLHICDQHTLLKMQSSSSRALKRFVHKSMAYGENQSQRKRTENNFLKRNFSSETLDRVRTLLKFGFTSLERDENKHIGQVLSTFILSKDKQSEAKGSLNVCDLWSQKMQRQCLERNRLSQERKVMQKYLYFQTRYEHEMKAKMLERWKRDPIIEESPQPSPHRSQFGEANAKFSDWSARGAYVKCFLNCQTDRSQLKSEMSKILDEMKKFQAENKRDIKTTNQNIRKNKPPTKDEMRQRISQRILS